MKFSKISTLKGIFLFGMCVCLFACTKTEKEDEALPPEKVQLIKAVNSFNAIKHDSAFSEEISEIIRNINENEDAFISEIQALVENDADDLLTLIDKTHSVSKDFIPVDLVPLVKNDAYPISRTDLSLRICVEQALKEMALAARKDGISLLVSSTFRSYEYQDKLFQRWVAIDGLEEAERESARPGTSQHQLGTAIDFGSIDDDYADTKPGRWLTENADRFGFSLSFPKAYEPITGYRWECWHFRYIGNDAVAMQKKWFNDVQQYLIEFVYCWKASQPLPEIES